MAYLLSGTARLRVLTVVFLLCAFCLGWGGGPQARIMLPATPGAPSTPLLPYLEYLLDESGTLDVEEAAAPGKAGEYRPLALRELPRASGVMWLRFTLAPLIGDARPATLLLDMGESVPGVPLLYEPVLNSLSGALEWRESAPAQRNVLLLPEAGSEAQTCYIRLDGLPGLWFAPMMRTPQNAAGNWGSLSGTGAALALGVVMLLCLLRGLSEKGQWRVWTALYVAVALAQGIMGMPASGSGHMGLGQLGAVLAPGVALMLLPHVGRHLMRTRERSPVLDIQLLLLSLPGAALALLPLLPDFVWLARYLDLWPLGTLMFVPTALGAWIMGLGGARRFLLGCLLPPLFVAGGILGLDSGLVDANLLASAPLWGTALSALLIAATRAPYDMAAERSDTDTAAEKAQGGDDEAITLGQPLDDPHPPLRSPAVGASVSPSVSDGVEDAQANAPSPLLKDFAPNPLESALRPSLDRLMREGAALGHCSLPPAVRRYAENMLGAAREMAQIISNPRQAERQTSVAESAAPFNLQHLMREAHDAVAPAAESAGIGLAWYMPPHLGHLYEGEGAALKETLCLLLESAVRATRQGVVHFSVRRVPESPSAGHLLFTVTDSGSGMPPQDRSSLALARAWELAGAHKGFLGVECGPHGATIAFTLHLKCLEADESETAPGARRQPLVLIAAESASERQSLARLLEGLPCRSVEARNLAEALQLHRAEAALLLVAQGAPASPLEGDMLRRFREAADEAGLPLFKALAVTEDDRQWDQLAEAGFTHALVEPVDGEALCQTVREILDAASAEGMPDAVDASAPTAPAADERQPEAEEAASARGDIAADAGRAAARAAGRPPLPDLFGSGDNHEASPLKIPDLTALPDLLSFAESLREPLLSAEKDKKNRAVEDEPSGHLPDDEASCAAVNLPPAEAAFDVAGRAMQEEFSAAAGLEGPVWSGEGRADTADAGSDTAASVQEAQAEKSEESPVDAAAVAEAVRDKAESAPQAEAKSDGVENAAPAGKMAENTDTPTPAGEPDAFIAEAAESVSAATAEELEARAAIEDKRPAPEPAPVQAATPEAAEEAAMAEAPRKPAFQPVTFATRPGATIVPIRGKSAAAAAPAPEAQRDATVGDADSGALDEWVGEPMPIGSSPSVPPQGRADDAAPRMESPVHRSGAQATQKSVYTSPGLSVPGEWVGEPMPIPKKASPVAPPVAEDAPEEPPARPAMPATPAAVSSASTEAAADEASSGGSIMDFIAGAEPVKRDAPSLATLVAEVSGPAQPDAPVPAPFPAEPAEASPAAAAPVQDSETMPHDWQAAPDETILRLVERLDAAMEDARQAFRNRRGSLVGEAAERIAAESDAFGFRVLARMARCVERAARANDMNALKDLLPELAVAVERNRIALTPRKQA